MLASAACPREETDTIWEVFGRHLDNTFLMRRCPALIVSSPSCTSLNVSDTQRISSERAAGFLLDSPLVLEIRKSQVSSSRSTKFQLAMSMHLSMSYFEWDM